MIKMVRPVNLENVRIGFRNFEGREGMYNKEGDRSFAVFLDPELADTLSKEGWHVKYPKERENVGPDPDSDGREPYIQVSVGFEYYPANIFVISNDNVTRMDESEVAMLDWAEIEKVDLVLRPYEWTVNGNNGVKAYLKSGYFTIVTDVFAEKYGV